MSATVADHLLRSPKTAPSTSTVGELREFFADDHVHLALLVSDGVLRGCVTRSDLLGATPETPALSVAGTADRVIRPAEPIAVALARLERSGGRRLAVVDETGRLLGLLCLKRSGTGFCSDADVAARDADCVRVRRERTSGRSVEERRSLAL